MYSFPNVEECDSVKFRRYVSVSLREESILALATNLYILHVIVCCMYYMAQIQVSVRDWRQ